MKDEVHREIEAKLRTVHPELVAAIGEAGDKHLLVIGCLGSIHGIAAALRLATVAPPIHGWQIVAMRIPNDCRWLSREQHELVPLGADWCYSTYYSSGFAVTFFVERESL